MAEELYVDNVNLKQVAKNVENLTATLRVPGKRTANIVVPGRHGTVNSGNKMYDQNVLVWNIWVIGANDDGSVPDPGTSTAKRTKFFQNLDTINELFGVAHRLLKLRHVLPDGTARVAYGQVLNVIDWTTVGVNPIGKVSVEIVLSDPFWYGETDVIQNIFVNQTSKHNGWTDSTYTAERATALGKFSGSNAPLTKMYIDLRGPFTTAELKLGGSSGSMVGPYKNVRLNCTQAATSSELIRIFTGSWIARRISTTFTNTIPNLIKNPSFEYDTVGGNPKYGSGEGYWTGAGGVSGSPIIHNNSTIVGVTAPSGSQYVRTTASGSGTAGVQTSFNIGASQSVRIIASMRTQVNSRSGELFIEYMSGVNGGGSVLSSATVSAGTITTTAWTTADSGSLTTPASTQSIRLSIRITSAVSGDQLLVDQVHAHNASTLPTYYDGDTDAFTGWSAEQGYSYSYKSSYTRTGLSTTTGTAVSATSLTHTGTVRMFEIPPDNRLLLAAALEPDYGDVVPVEVRAEFTGTIGASTGVSFIAKNAYLSG